MDIKQLSILFFDRSRFGAWLNEKPGTAVELAIFSIIVLLFILQPTLMILMLGGLSLMLRHKSWKEIGLAFPQDPKKVIQQAFAISIGWVAIDMLFISPMISDFLGQPSDMSQLSAVPENLIGLVGWLILSWTLAAFGEEIVYRGYLINRFSDLSGKTEAGWMIGGLFSAVLFGLAHVSQGPTGMVDKFLLGAFLGGLYLYNRRDLSLPILVHGMVNMLGLAAISFGKFL